MLIQDCGEKLVDLKNKKFVLEPLYFEWKYSETPEMKLRSGIEEKLQEALKILRSKSEQKNWNFKIWDAFRTLKTQQLLYDDYWQKLEKKHSKWNKLQLKEATEEFVAFPSYDPLNPAPHNTGAAVDLTLVDDEGRELAMGTTFDEFNDKAHTLYFAEKTDKKSAEFHKNRMILKEVLEEVGFVNYKNEWWHFSYGDQAWARTHGHEHAIYASMELNPRGSDILQV